MRDVCIYIYMYKIEDFTSPCFIVFRIYKQCTKKRLQKVVLLHSHWMNLIKNHCSFTWQNSETGCVSFLFFFAGCDFWNATYSGHLNIPLYLIHHSVWVLLKSETRLQCTWKYVFRQAQVQNLRYAWGLWNYINLSSFRAPPLPTRLGPALVWPVQDAGW